MAGERQRARNRRCRLARDRFRTPQIAEAVGGLVGGVWCFGLLLCACYLLGGVLRCGVRGVYTLL